MSFETIQRYGSALRRQWVPATTVLGAVLVCTTVVTFVQTPLYEAQGQLLLKQSDSAAALTGLNKGRGELSGVARQSNPLATETEILRSVPLANQVIARVGLVDGQGKPLDPEVFLKRLTVENLRGTDILAVSYLGRDPRQAERIVDTLMDRYRENDVVSNREEAATARRFIDQQLPRVETSLHKAEVALRDYREKHDIVNLDEEGKAAVGILANLENQLTQTQANLKDATSRASAISQKVGMDSRQAMALTSLNQSLAVQEVVTQLQQVQAQLATDRTRYGPVHPAIRSLEEKEAALKGLLQKRAKQVMAASGTTSNKPLYQMGALKQELVGNLVRTEVERLGLNSRIAALTSLQERYRTRIGVLPRLAQGQQELERRLKAAQTTYELLSQKLQEIRVSENQNIGNARIVAQARAADTPAAPSKPLNLALGGLLGSLLALALVLIREARDTSLKTVQEVKDQFNYLLLGTIPLMEADQPQLGVSRLEPLLGDGRPATVVVVRDRPDSPVSETFRIIQTNLKILSQGRKTFVVSSCVAGEGKSTISVNLAVALAQLNRRVLLIDADLRRPSQHDLWDLPNREGLSNVLLGEVALQTALRPVMDNLEVLTSGIPVPNPLALLDSETMARLVQDLHGTYDYVLIDTPPLLEAADASILGRMGDGFLLVVRPGVVDFGTAASGRELLEHAGQNVLGQVINGVIPSNEPSPYYARGYYSGYTAQNPVS
ncbi:GumC family protein [Anthocerotibacter panamensis]|uniref:GumC family protein n=1 Tax=Anthocerotibacter panamensis TaxID=2857077 RepID=UPI001C402983|nr:polysaccharide biosynthesis tyrosine autokinase [Anthocerotibacter panamensis]